MSKLMRNIKQTIRDKCAWPGGYQMFLVTSDGGILCPDCARTEFKQIVYANMHRLNNGWRVIGIDSSATTEEYTVCDQCNKVLVDPDKE